MRLGINIPNDLIKRLEPLKPFINISQLCRDVILKYVSLYEKAKQQSDNDATDKVVKSLFEANTPIVVDFELDGLQDAKQWETKASPDDWERIFEHLDYYEREGKSPFDQRVSIPRIEGVKTYYDRQYEYDTDDGWFAQRINDPKNPYEVAQLEYQRGFLTYIIIIRQKRNELQKTYLKTKMDQHKRAKSDIKTRVEVPKTLLG
jgi:hypothetical protein